MSRSPWPTTTAAISIPMEALNGHEQSECDIAIACAKCHHQPRGAVGPPTFHPRRSEISLTRMIASHARHPRFNDDEKTTKNRRGFNPRPEARRGSEGP